LLGPGWLLSEAAAAAENGDGDGLGQVHLSEFSEEMLETDLGPGAEVQVALEAQGFT